VTRKVVICKQTDTSALIMELMTMGQIQASAVIERQGSLAYLIVGYRSNGSSGNETRTGSAAP